MGYLLLGEEIPGFSTPRSIPIVKLLDVETKTAAKGHGEVAPSVVASLGGFSPPAAASGKAVRLTLVYWSD